MIYPNSIYTAGTISVTNGSTAFVGDGTAWDLNGAVGAFTVIGDTFNFVETLTDDNHGDFYFPWTGPTQVDVPYYMWLVTSEAALNLANHERLAELLQSIKVAQEQNVILDAISSLTPEANQVPMFTSPTTLTLINKTELVTGVATDRKVSTLVQRAAYDAQASGYSVLVMDNPGENQLDNGGFEAVVPTTDWNVGAGCTINTTQQRSGINCMAMDKGVVGAGGTQREISSINLETVVPGVSYDAAAYIKGSGASVAGCTIQINWRDASDVSLGMVSVVNSAAFTTGYIEKRGSAVAPALAAFARVYIRITVAATCQIMYVDDVKLQRTLSGRSAIYSKASNTAGDWTDPGFLTGEVGATPMISVGTTTTLTPGDPATVEDVGTDEFPIFNFGIPSARGFYFKGTYNPVTAYTKDDVVVFGTSSYIALVNTTGNEPPTLPATANTQWQLIALGVGMTYHGIYTPATNYVINDVVTYRGSAYIALQGTVGNAPPTLPTTANAYWSLLAEGKTLVWRGVYSDVTDYLMNDLVSDQESTWIALIDTTGNPPPSLPTASNTQWQLVAMGQGLTFLGDYSGITQYQLGDAVLRDNSTWVAKLSTLGNDPPNLPTTSNTWWQLVAAKGGGDLAGPASSLVGNLPVFSDTTGKIVGDSGVSIRLSNLRNWIMNPEFFVWQRGTTISAPINGGYGPDRWRIAWNGTGSVRTLSRAAMAPGHTIIPGNPAFTCRINQTTAGTGATVNDLRHDMESVKWSSGLTYTLTFYMWATGTPTIPLVYLLQNFGTGGSPSTAVSTVTPLANFTLNNGVPTKYQAVVTLPSISGKTLGTSGDDSLQLRISLPLNTTFDIYITRVSFVEGDVSGIDDPFVPRPMGDEYNDCMRFYESSNNRFTGDVTGTVGYNIWTHFKMPKRFIPTVVLTNAGASRFPATTGLGAATTGGFNETRTASTTGPGGTYASTYTADCDW